jgi:hypothetical protein
MVTTSVGRLRTAVLERIPGLLPSDDYGSSVERRPERQVSWQVLRPQVMVASRQGAQDWDQRHAEQFQMLGRPLLRSATIGATCTWLAVI